MTGWLKVLPNALLAFYYAWRGQPEVLYSSQAGDGHICIPLCVGLFALFQPLEVPALFNQALALLAGALALHFLFVLVLRGFPRWMAVALVAAYAAFLYHGLRG
jgi:cation:H+ antiporter